MIDNVRMLIGEVLQDVSDQIIEPIVMYGITGHPNTSHRGTVTYKGMYKNLKIEATARGTIIQGSLHTLIHESNHGDFTYSNLCQALEELSELTSGATNTARTTQMEFGVNLGDIYYDSWEAYKHKPFHPMIAKGKVYGKKGYQSQNNLKGYNKSLERKKQNVNVEDGIYRIEKIITNMAHLRKRKEPISIYTLEDLLNPSILMALRDDLISSIGKVSFREVIDLTSLSISEKRIVACMLTDDVKQAIRSNHSRTSWQDQKVYKSILKAQKLDKKKELINRIIDEWNNLMKR
ncbi:hypothetical protein N8364_01065 [Saprospiraceae bacterium]|nr:hypothetical protein [Saprospiraceae bacterium]